MYVMIVYSHHNSMLLYRRHHLYLLTPLLSLHGLQVPRETYAAPDASSKTHAGNELVHVVVWLCSKLGPGGPEAYFLNAPIFL